MNGFVTISARSPDYQRAFVAMRYFWGARNEALTEALDTVGVQPGAADLVAGLRDPEKQVRAQALAQALGQLGQALEQRGLGPC